MAWYAIKSKAGKEYQARDNLSAQEIWTYLPEVPRDWRTQKPRKYNWAPLFTGYLFAYLKPGETNFNSIKNTRGVSYVVGFGGEPAKMTEAEIEEIRQLEKVMRPGPDYQKGEKIRIRGGAFEGYEAIFHAKSGKERAEILIMAMGKARSIRVKIQDLEPAA